MFSGVQKFRNFTITFSAYIPRTQRTDRTERNALSVHEPGNASLSGNLTRSTSLRTPRIRNDEIEDSSISDFRRDRDKDRDKGIFLRILSLLSNIGKN